MVSTPNNPPAIDSNSVNLEARRNTSKDKGGFRATCFIYVAAALENMGFMANATSLVLYFSYEMYFNVPTSANTLTNFMASTYLLSKLTNVLSK